MTCPFLAGVKGGSSSGPPIVCPISHDVPSAADEPAAHKKASSEAVCPLGYGSNSGPKLSTLHCVLCRALLHDPVQTRDCKHKFCRFCIQRFSDCPICGMDITGVEPHAELKGLVDTFIAAHGKDPSLLADKVDWGAAALRASLASFYLQIAMQSFAGGNFAAALARLQACEAQLLQEQQEQQEQQRLASSVEAAASSAAAASADAADAADAGGGFEGTGNAAACRRHEQRQQHQQQQQHQHEQQQQQQQQTRAAAGRCPFRHLFSSPSTSQEDAPAAVSAPVPAAAHSTTASAEAPAPSAAAPAPAPAAPSPAALACQLGAVWGSQGDCLKRLGDAAAAARQYQRSLDLLAPHAEADAEVAHALSVTSNKLGDLLYTAGDVQGALGCYQRAHSVRSRLAQLPGAAAEQRAERSTDLAASCIKVADALAAAGQVQQARGVFEEARALLGDVARGGGSSAGTAAKAEGFRRLVEAQLQQLALTHG